MVSTGDGTAASNEETTVIKVPDEFYLEEQECFVRTVLGETFPYYPDINDGIATQKILDAAIESAGCGIRLLWIYTVFPNAPGMDMLMVIYPITQTIAAVIHSVCYIRLKKHIVKNTYVKL